MYEQVEKPKENKNRAVANSVTQKKRDVKQRFGFVDNRPNIRNPSSVVIQRQPMDLDQERQNNPAVETFYWNILRPWLVQVEELHPEASGTIQDINEDIEAQNWDVYSSWEDIESIVLMVNARINEGAPQYAGEVEEDVPVPLTPVEQFVNDHDGAVIIDDMKNLNNQLLEATGWEGMGHTYQQAMGHQAGGLPTYEGHHVYHDTHYQNCTLFLISIDNTAILVATGHHNNPGDNSKYRLDWACDGNVNWVTNNYLSTNGAGPQVGHL